jgi:hypothetical protein
MLSVVAAKSLVTCCLGTLEYILNNSNTEQVLTQIETNRER